MGLKGLTKAFQVDVTIAAAYDLKKNSDGIYNAFLHTDPITVCISGLLLG
jgi:hypothetical protein